MDQTNESLTGLSEACSFGDWLLARKRAAQRNGWIGTDLNIEDWRDEIDRLDEQLVKLLNARSQCAIELGRIKRELGLAIYSPDREREVIAHVTGINPGPLDRTAVRRLFERIIDESRRIERVTVEKEAKSENSGKRKKREKG